MLALLALERKQICLMLWAFTQIIVFCFTCSCWASATDISNDSSLVFVERSRSRDPLVFDVVWSSFLVIGAAVFSGLVLFKPQMKTSMNYGIMIGLWTICSNIGLTLAARFANHQFSGSSSFTALAVFGALLFVCGVLMTLVFIFWHPDILASDTSSFLSGGSAYEPVAETVHSSLSSSHASGDGPSNPFNHT